MWVCCQVYIIPFHFGYGAQGAKTSTPSPSPTPFFITTTSKVSFLYNCGTTLWSSFKATFFAQKNNKASHFLTGMMDFLLLKSSSPVSLPCLPRTLQFISSSRDSFTQLPPLIHFIPLYNILLLLPFLQCFLALWQGSVGACSAPPQVSTGSCSAPLSVSAGGCFALLPVSIGASSKHSVVLSSTNPWNWPWISCPTWVCVWSAINFLWRALLTFFSCSQDNRRLPPRCWKGHLPQYHWLQSQDARP